MFVSLLHIRIKSVPIYVQHTKYYEIHHNNSTLPNANNYHCIHKEVLLSCYQSTFHLLSPQIQLDEMHMSVIYINNHDRK